MTQLIDDVERRDREKRDREERKALFRQGREALLRQRFESLAELSRRRNFEAPDTPFPLGQRFFEEAMPFPHGQNSAAAIRECGYDLGDPFRAWMGLAQSDLLHLCQTADSE